MVIYETYHAKLPGLKRTARQAEELCRQRGYVKNIHGRRRHLPNDWAHKAFNTVNQSSAADIMKERLVALHRADLLDLIGVVHDEIIGVIHKDAYDELLKVKVATILESPSASLRVPLRIGFGLSSDNWLAASDNSAPVKL
jgi:DNA polymerase I-like protein with 3'-5' exonuclease and polymerase domains